MLWIPYGCTFTGRCVHTCGHTFARLCKPFLPSRQQSVPHKLRVPIKCLLPREILRSGSKDGGGQNGSIDLIFVLDACETFRNWEQVCVCPSHSCPFPSVSLSVFVYMSVCMSLSLFFRSDRSVSLCCIIPTHFMYLSLSCAILT